jgi:hypothetical protein
LDRNDRLGLLEPLAQPGVLTFEFRHSARERGRGHRRAAALLGGQRGQAALLALPTPGRQMRRVQSLAPEQRAQLPVPAQVSACRRTPSLYSAVNRRRAARSATSGSGVEIGGTTCSTVGLLLIGLRLAVSAFPSLRAAIGDRGRLAFFARAMGKTPLSALYSNSREGPCLTIVGTEGHAHEPGVCSGRSSEKSEFNVRE